jgi:hypothetical protein
VASTEVDLIRQLTRTLRKVWLIHGTGDAFTTGKGSELGEDVRAALQGAEQYFKARGIPEREEDD